jgi:para-nitrobenzyl esterase
MRALKNGPRRTWQAVIALGAMTSLLISLLCAGVIAPIAAGATTPGAAGASHPGNPVVQTHNGAVRGVSAGGADRFLGIPYARPPLKNLRFRPPQPPTSWRGVRDATDLPPACLQFQPTGVREGQAVSEDCLYLDLYRPSGARSGAKVPVLVWFHGGGWTQGTGVIYGGQTMARLTKTIVISINYRLGALGWLALPQLDKEQPLTMSGNYGMLDQIRALRWVRDNVASFGGDPRNVTVDGQSAGGGAVCTMLASPLARGLFSHAIIESLGCTQGASTLPAAEKTGQQYAAAAGCTDAAAILSCLRSAWAPNLIAAAQKISVAAPAYGTPVLPKLPSDAIASGNWNKVPVLIGGVRWEGKLFVINQANLTAAQYVAEITSTFGANAGAVLAHYPVSAYATPFYALAAVMTDGGIGIACAVNGTANQLAPQTQVYRYEFNDPTSPTLYGFQPPGIDMSNAHSAELAYLFDFTLGYRPLTAYEKALSYQMIRYWAAFARDGNPNVPNQPTWPRFTTATHRTLVLRPSGNTVSTDIGAEHNCAFWSSIS